MQKNTANQSKICKDCKLELPLDRFTLRSDRGYRFYRNSCKKCECTKASKRPAKKKWFATNKHRHKRYDLKAHYGITLEQFEQMKLSQNGLCKICQTVPKVINVDHCHKTGQVRGLLCTGCNMALGGFKDSIFNLEQAIKYLKEVPQIGKKYSETK